MSIFDIFSKRKKQRENAGRPDVFQYDDLPERLRVQVFHIWKTAIGPRHHWKFIENTLARELGLFGLDKSSREDFFVGCCNFLLAASTENALDIIELSFRLIDRVIRGLHESDRERRGITQQPDDAIAELNHRFREHGVGYEYLHGMILRKDSQYVHSEVVTPALTLLQDAKFTGATEEFMQAHRHYRNGDAKDAISSALKAFESTMKGICDQRKWKYAPNATAKPLLDILITKGLVPPDLSSHFRSLRAAMESGLPTLRNRRGGHGQGQKPVVVPGHFAAYALHLCAANVVFLVQAHSASK